MDLFFNNLNEQLERKLFQLQRQSADPFYISEQALHLILEALLELKRKVLDTDFDSEADEIDFFRNKKPLISSKLIYFNAMLQMESGKPIGDKKCLKAYYRSQLQQLERYFYENIEFYRYYRSGQRDFDHLYFKRGVTSAFFFQNPIYLEQDGRFSTSHDYKVAHILANDLLQAYLEEALLQLEADAPATLPKVRWTGSKVALVELIYALQAEGVLNHGEVLLKDLAQVFERMFQIELGHIPRLYLEIRERKAVQTKFMDQLTQSLARRLREADY